MLHLDGRINVRADALEEFGGLGVAISPADGAEQVREFGKDGRCLRNGSADVPFPFTSALYLGERETGRRRFFESESNVFGDS
jgi:hypothetical protein